MQRIELSHIHMLTNCLDYNELTSNTLKHRTKSKIKNNNELLVYILLQTLSMVTGIGGMDDSLLEHF